MVEPLPSITLDPARSVYGLGDRVLVSRDPGLAPAEVLIVATNHARPHLVKVRYLHLRTGAWIARRRIVGLADDAAGPL